jgi:hypothetical protein
MVRIAVLRVGSGFVLRLRTETSQVHQVLCEVLGQAYWGLVLGLKQAIACLSESDFRSAAATEPAGLV